MDFVKLELRSRIRSRIRHVGTIMLKKVESNRKLKIQFKLLEHSLYIYI